MAEQGPSAKLFVPALAGLYEPLSHLTYPLIRFSAGLFLMPHGAAKLFGLFGGDINRTIAGFGKLGLEPAMPLAYLVGLTEFVGGLLIAIGFLTRPAAIGAAILLAVTVFHVHLANGFFWNKGGYEYPLLWMIIMIGIFFRGAGPLSVDGKIGKEF